MKKEQLTKEIKVGMLVLVSILVLVLFFFKMGKFDFTKKGYNIGVTFNYAGGIAENSPVRLLGIKIGKVEKIDIKYGDETKVHLTLWVDQSAKLKTDARASVSALGIMGEKHIELNPGSNSAPALAEGGTIVGDDPFQMEALTKNGQELMTDLRATLVNIKSLAANIDSMVLENRDEIKKIMQNVEITTDHLKELSSDLKNNPWKIITKPKDWKSRL